MKKHFQKFDLIPDFQIPALIIPLFKISFLTMYYQIGSKQRKEI